MAGGKGTGTGRGNRRERKWTRRGNAFKGQKDSARSCARLVFAEPRRTRASRLTSLAPAHSISQFKKNNNIGYGVTANITASQSPGSNAVARGSIPRIRISFVASCESNDFCTQRLRAAFYPRSPCCHWASQQSCLRRIISSLPIHVTHKCSPKSCSSLGNWNASRERWIANH